MNHFDHEYDRYHTMVTGALFPHITVEEKVTDIKHSLFPLARLSLLSQAVVDWGMARGILVHSTAKEQFLKTVSEMGELADALAKDDLVDDAIGDILVTLIMVAELSGTDITTCLQTAYNEIKDRKGQLTPQGVFVKEELPDQSSEL